MSSHNTFITYAPYSVYSIAFTICLLVACHTLVEFASHGINSRALVQNRMLAKSLRPQRRKNPTRKRIQNTIRMKKTHANRPIATPQTQCNYPESIQNANIRRRNTQKLLLILFEDCFCCVHFVWAIS